MSSITNLIEEIFSEEEDEFIEDIEGYLEVAIEETEIRDCRNPDAFVELSCQDQREIAEKLLTSIKEKLLEKWQERTE